MARERLTRFLAWRVSGKLGGVRASIAAFDEMWTYLGIRRGGMLAIALEERLKQAIKSISAEG